MNSKHSGKSFILLLLSVTAGLTGVVRSDEKDPHPDSILEAARRSAAQAKNVTLEGQLRRYETRKRAKFKVTFRPGQIVFMFPEKPEHIIALDIMENGHRLRESKQGSEFADVPSAAYGNDIRGMGVNYLDISMAYLYWPNAVFEAHDRVSDMLAYRVSVKNPHKGGPYGSVRLWINKESGAPVRIQGISRAGKVIKQMEIRKVQRVDDTLMPKRMDITTINPNTGRSISRTFMEL
jgi:hypothetical protein